MILDTNVLLRLVRDKQLLQRQLFGGMTEDLDFVIAPQTLYEFWAVATRPVGVNGFGFAPEKADREIRAILEHFNVLDDSPGMWRIWRQLCVDHAVLGKQAHDARLAAFVVAHQLDGIVTFNGPDFRRFRIGVIAPN